jgi:hypothetical protein
MVDVKGENEITLMQSHYVEKNLSCFIYKDSKLSSTPYDPSLVLRKNISIGRYILILLNQLCMWPVRLGSTSN